MDEKEGNILIAEFMGLSKASMGYMLKYNYDWGWLMGVVEKMNKTELWDEYNISDLSIALVSVHIKYTYNLVVEFIKWYNSQKNV